MAIKSIPASQSRPHAPATGSPSGPVAPGDNATTPSAAFARDGDGSYISVAFTDEPAKYEGDPEWVRLQQASPFGPVADITGRPYIRLTQSMREEHLLEEIEFRLREGSPKSGAKHVRLTDSRMIGPNEFEELGTPFHWTTWACVIVAVCVAAIFAMQLFSDHLERLF